MRRTREQAPATRPAHVHPASNTEPASAAIDTPSLATYRVRGAVAIRRYANEGLRRDKKLVLCAVASFGCAAAVACFLKRTPERSLPT